MIKPDEARHILSLLVAIIMRNGGSMKISMKTLRELSGREYSFSWEVDQSEEYGTLSARFELPIIEGEPSCTPPQSFLTDETTDDDNTTCSAA